MGAAGAGKAGGGRQGAFGGDFGFSCQINQMREDIALGRGQQRGGGVGVDAFGQVARGGRAGVERGENGGFAGQAVADQPVEPRRRVGYRRAVAGVGARGASP